MFHTNVLTPRLFATLGVGAGRPKSSSDGGVAGCAADESPRLVYVRSTVPPASRKSSATSSPPDCSQYCTTTPLGGFCPVGWIGAFSGVTGCGAPPPLAPNPPALAMRY